MSDPSNLLRLHNPEQLPPPVGFSQVAEIEPGGRLILISGQISRDSSGATVGGSDFRAQLIQTFRNLQLALEAAGATFADVVKLNYYCVDSIPDSEFPTVREVRDHFLNTKSPPASTFVFVSRLVRPDWLIEIEALAVVRPI